jgi:hypothetical protein
LEGARGRTGELSDLFSRSNNVKILPLPPSKGGLFSAYLTPVNKTLQSFY